MPEKMTTSKYAWCAGVTRSDTFSLVHNMYFCRVCSSIHDGNRRSV